MFNTLVNVSSYCREKPTTSKSVKGVADSRLRREIAFPEGFLHVEPGSEGSLLALLLVIQELVEDFRPHVAHSDVVQIGKREAHSKVHFRFRLETLVVFSPT